MTLCYLGLGANLKSPERLLRQALHAIRKLPKTSLLRRSSFYWNSPWGVHAQPRFCNTVVAVNTSLAPMQLLRACQHIESCYGGRKRKKRWGPRTIDIDILTYGQLRSNSPKLRLPHPFMHLRDFVIIPLAEISS